MPISGDVTPPEPAFETTDFSDEAILASWQGQEDEIDLAEEEVPEEEVPVTFPIDYEEVHPIYAGPHLGEWSGIISRRRREERVDPSELLDDGLPAEVSRVYPSRKIKIVTSISRAEKGYFCRQKAHFIILKVERKGDGPLELASLNIKVKVDKVQPGSTESAPAVLLGDSADALSALSLDSGAQTEALPATTTPPAPDSLDPLQIIRFAPEKVVGLPSTIKYTDDLEIEGDLGFDAYGAKLGGKGTRKWGTEYEREEHFSVWANVDDGATYDSDIAAPGKSRKDASLSVLHLNAAANPVHDEGIPNITIGLVVISYGQPFILTVLGEAKPRKGDSIFFRPFSRSSPAKFSYQSKVHLLHGQEAVKVDYGSKEMNRHWKKLVGWPLEYRNNLLGGV